MRLAIRPSTYRGRNGYLISGRDGRGRQVSIFTVTRASAERIRDKVRAGRRVELDDFNDAGPADAGPL
jgi:hypothetical protein